MTNNKLDRRSWMSGVGAAAAGMALGAATLEGESVEGGTPPPQSAPFQPARHAVDEWLDTLPGKHRVIVDTTTATGAGTGLAYAANFYAANRSGYQLENADLAVVVCLRHLATALAFNNAMWAKYGKQLAEGAEYKDPAGAEPPVTNPRNSGTRPELDNLAKRGAHFAVCGLATRYFAGLIAGRGANSDAVFKELSDNTVPNAHIMAAGVVAITRAQEYGYGLIYAG